MTIHIQFDAQVQEKVGGPGGQTVAAPTVREALHQVARDQPKLRLFNCEGEMRSVFHIRRGESEAPLDGPAVDGETLTLALI